MKNVDIKIAVHKDLVILSRHVNGKIMSITLDKKTSKTVINGLLFLDIVANAETED